MRYRRLLEHDPDRCVDAELVTDAVRGAGGQQRVTAQFDEIVVQANGLHAEQFGEDRRDSVLVRKRWSRVGGTQLRSRNRWLGQGRMIDLAVGGQRQTGNQDIGRRAFVLG